MFRLFILEGPYLIPIQHNHRHNGAKLNDHHKHFPESLADVQLYKLFHQNQMSRAADWQPLGDTFYDSQEDNL